jgi:hypothetical protein
MKTILPSRKKKDDLLGMPYGTACNRLRKLLMFRMAVALGLDICFRCRERIQSDTDFSIEHKNNWQEAEDPLETFLDAENIAFSHLLCNTKASKGFSAPLRHGSAAGYRRGCRCAPCVHAKREYNAKFMTAWRTNGRDRSRRNFMGL